MVVVVYFRNRRHSATLSRTTLTAAFLFLRRWKLKNCKAFTAFYEKFVMKLTSAEMLKKLTKGTIC